MDEPLDLRQCALCHCLAARRRARAITRLFEARLRPHGLRATQFSILAALALIGPRRMSELAARLGLERTTLTRGAAVLEGRGWVAGEATRDRRERLLRLTPEGRQHLEAAFPAWKQAQDLVEAQGREGATAPVAPPARKVPAEVVDSGPARSTTRWSVTPSNPEDRDR